MSEQTFHVEISPPTGQENTTGGGATSARPLSALSSSRPPSRQPSPAPPAMATGSLARPALLRSKSHVPSTSVARTLLDNNNDASAQIHHLAASSSSVVPAAASSSSSLAAASGPPVLERRLSASEDIQRHLMRRSQTQHSSGSKTLGADGGIRSRSEHNLAAVKHTRSHTHATVPSPPRGESERGSDDTLQSSHSHHHHHHQHGSNSNSRHGQHGSSSSSSSASLLSNASLPELQFLNASLLQELQYYDVLSRELAAELEASLEHAGALQAEAAAAARAADEFAVAAEVARREGLRAQKGAQQRQHEAWLREQAALKQVQQLTKTLKQLQHDGGRGGGGGSTTGQNGLGVGSRYASFSDSTAALATPSVSLPATPSAAGAAEHRITIPGHSSAASAASVSSVAATSLVPDAAAARREQLRAEVKARRDRERARLRALPANQNSSVLDESDDDDEEDGEDDADADDGQRQPQKQAHKKQLLAELKDGAAAYHDDVFDDEATSSNASGDEDGHASVSNSATRRSALRRAEQEELWLHDRFDSELEQQQQQEHPSSHLPAQSQTLAAHGSTTAHNGVPAAASVVPPPSVASAAPTAGFVSLSQFQSLQAHCRRLEARLGEQQAYWTSYLDLVRSEAKVRVRTSNRAVQTDLPLNAPSDAFLASYAQERLVFVTPNIWKAIERAHAAKRGNTAAATANNAQNQTGSSSRPGSQATSPERIVVPSATVPRSNGSSSAATSPNRGSQAAPRSPFSIPHSHLASSGIGSLLLPPSAAGSLGSPSLALRSPLSSSSATQTLLAVPAGRTSSSSSSNLVLDAIAAPVSSSALLASPLSAASPVPAPASPSRSLASVPVHLAQHVSESSLQALQSSVPDAPAEAAKTTAALTADITPDETFRHAPSLLPPAASNVHSTETSLGAGADSEPPPTHFKITTAGQQLTNGAQNA